MPRAGFYQVISGSCVYGETGMHASYTARIVVQNSRTHDTLLAYRCLLAIVRARVQAGKPKVPFTTLYPKANVVALDLLDKLLAFNPDKRVSCWRLISINE